MPRSPWPASGSPLPPSLRASNPAASLKPAAYEVVIRERPRSLRIPLLSSWAPTRPKAKGRLSVSEAIRALAKSFATWVIVVALAIDALAVITEPTRLLSRHTPLHAAIATTLAALGVSTLFSLAAAIPIAAVHGLVRLVGRFPRPFNFAWPLPLAGLAWLVVADLAPRPFVDLTVRAEGKLILFGLLGCLLLLATGVTRFKQVGYRTACGALLAALMVGLSLALPPSIHREPRDIVWVCVVVSAVGLLYPLRRKLREMPNEHVAALLGGLCGYSLLFLLLANVASPNWRVYARDHGRFAEPLMRFCRTLADFDDDGYANIFGGGDCDPLDPARNPGVPENVDGIDRNCNGLTRPKTPTPADCGLARAVGEADAAPGEIDRVVLITVDCFRSDALLPSVTPNLLRLARRGVRFNKLYAGGSRTTMSLPLLLRGSYAAPSVAGILGRDGVTSTAIFSYRHSTLQGNAFAGFSDVKRPPATDKRYRASEVTDLALEDLRSPANARKHLLWVHYFDAHGPRSARVLPSDLRDFPALPGEDADSALYLSELAYDDREIGRLIDGMQEAGGLDKSLVIVTGDHGEGFGLHYEYEHGQSAYEEILHVPGIFVAPRVSGQVYEHVVSHRDIAATVLGAFGLVSENPSVEDFGRSWLRLRAAPHEPLHEFVITYTASTHVQRWSEAPMLVRTDDQAKLAVSYREGIQRLYRLDAPTSEWLDVAPWHPDEVARDRRQLEVYRDIDRPPP
ncbi:MAG TPA: sulfatase-like hydrolase/transferase [Polyangiaceae bacterium]|nr:sulfatase-like hydrolase/transferase [Polyangiaceae bacterium]